MFRSGQIGKHLTLPKFRDTLSQSRRRWLRLVALWAACIYLTGCGGGSAATAGKATSQPSTPSSPPTATSTSGPQFTRANWAELASNPDAYKGASVDIVGKVFIDPQRDTKGTYFQMWADPKNSEWNTVVGIGDPNSPVSNNDYVRVVGTVKGKYEGKNAFGGDVSAVAVKASSAKVVDATAAATPPIRVAQVNARQMQNGVTFVLQRVEYATDETRVFVTVENAGKATAHFYGFDSKAVQGTTEYSAKSFTDYPEVQSDILSGVRSSGVVAFPPMHPSKATKFVFTVSSDDYNLTFQPFTFIVK
jgi:hypothetical protein